MKKLVIAFALASGLSGCAPTFTESEARFGGAVIGGAIANSAGASDLSVALGVVGGYVAGGALNRAQDAGCHYTSGPIRGAVNFRNVNDGVYLACPNARPGTRFIEELRRSPDWTFVPAGQQNRPRGNSIFNGSFR